MTQKLTDDEIAAGLEELEGWTLLEDRPAISKKFKFRDFPTAWNFMDDVAGYSDEISHHPEWTNIYNRVEIILSTHDVGGLSELDLDLAAFIDEAASHY